MTDREGDRPEDAGTAADGPELETALAERHLPALASKGYVEWDPETGTIRRGPNFDEVAPLFGESAELADSADPAEPSDPADAAERRSDDSR